MRYKNSRISEVLRDVDLGGTVAERDTKLESARVETSVFSDLLADRVDLIAGTKGSGKSAIYRVFVDFASDVLLRNKKVVIAHGVQAQGDDVFHAFRDEFEALEEGDFVNFWCIYLVSLANEHFIKSKKYSDFLKSSSAEVKAFHKSCYAARIPDIEAPKTLRGVLRWALDAIPRPNPKLKAEIQGVDVEMTLFGDPPKADRSADDAESLPRYVSHVGRDLEAVLKKSGLSLWLMIDRLDEIFPRRSQQETKALRGLLRAMRIFSSPSVRIKVFLRDDILEQITEGGFTALTHLMDRKADNLRWTEAQILKLVVNRLFTSPSLCDMLQVDRNRLSISPEYQREMFYAVFPATVHRGKRQSPTLRWIFTHTADGRGIVTPRDVIELLTRAKQKQLTDCEGNPDGYSDAIIGSAAIRYGLSELSKMKRITFLDAEFPHFKTQIDKFFRGKTAYSEAAVKKLIGRDHKRVLHDLLGVGFLSEVRRAGKRTFQIPFLYRDGLELSQGMVE